MKNRTKGGRGRTKSGPARSSRFKFKVLLVPIDFSKSADKALAYSAALARSLGAEIRLLHVIEGTKVATESFQWIDFSNEVKAVVTPMLENLARRIQKQGIPIRTEVGQGTPYLEIVNRARRQKADMIIMGTHGRTGVQRWIMGSVAERVVRIAACPVLTIHP